MSDLHRDPEKHVARKCHRCIACYGVIPVAERYVQQTGYFENEAYCNRYHQECWDALSDEPNFEFTPGCIDQPERLAQTR